MSQATPSRRLFLAVGPVASVCATLAASLPASGFGSKLSRPAIPARVLVALDADKEASGFSPVLARSVRDPVFAALDAYREARNAMRALVSAADEDLFDAACDREWAARAAVLGTIPNTLAGAIQLMLFTANQIEKEDEDIGRAVDGFTAYVVSRYGTEG